LAKAIDVRYVLEGEARPEQSATEIRLRMVDGASGEQLWNETVSLKEPATSAYRTSSLRAAMEHMRNRLFDVEMRRVNAQPAATSAMDIVLRARALGQAHPSLELLRRQETMYEEALRSDPDLVPAMVRLVSVLDQEGDLDSSIDHERMLRRMDELSSRAVSLNRDAPETWFVRSGALMLAGRWDAALEASAKAIQLDPDVAWLVANRAWEMSLVGNPAEALMLVAQAIAMDPPGSWYEMRVACEAHVLLGQYDQAIAACEKAAGRGGDDFDIAYFLTAAYGHRGDTARAAEERAKILGRAPGFTIAVLRGKRYSVNPEYMRLAEAHWYSGLRKAGIPEK
jgi:tetratricopeptide (TPR) repeat protein